MAQSANPTFVQLNADDCTYLLDLILDMDSNTKYTERQREYTVPKLQRIQKDPRSARLAYQDVDYLLELIEDDDLPDTEQQRFMTQERLQAIKSLQDSRFESMRAIEQQRELRRARRNAASALSAHFEHTSPVQEGKETV